jgi:hypothetical protein
MVKLNAKATKPSRLVTSSGKVWGTSSDTTSRVAANPNTASLKASRRVTSRPRSVI